MVRGLSIAGIAVVCAGSTASAGNLYISANVPNIEIGVAGNLFVDEDVILTNEAGSVSSLFFTIAPSSGDTNAFHIRPDGKYVFSGLFNYTFAGGAFEDDDLVLYDPIGGTASFLIDGTSFFDGTTSDFDAITQLPNGNYLFSTLAAASVGGSAFTDGDIMEWDPIGGTVSLWASMASIFDDGVGDIGGLHYMPDGSLLMTFNDNETISGTAIREADIVRWDPLSDSASLFFNGDAIDSGGFTKELDAIYWEVPSPGTGILGAGALVLGARRRRRA